MISVIIPTYNRGRTIERCINSVIYQTYKDIEIIIVDDNSTDNTEDIILKIDDERLKYIKLINKKGACYARNVGIDMAKGEYVAFQDSDDEWLLDKLEKQLAYLEIKKIDIVSCKMEQIYGDNDLRIFPQNIMITESSIYSNNQISTQTILGKKECFINEKFDIDLPRFQDWDLVLRLIKNYKCEIIDEVLVRAYIQEDSISKNSHKAVQALQIFLKRHAVNNKSQGIFLRLLALYKMQNNDSYRKYLFKAFYKNPMNKTIIIDFILCLFIPRKLHYKLHLIKGRFK